MLRHFCKLCYQVADESIVKLRTQRYSVKHYKLIQESVDDDEEVLKHEEVLVDTEEEEPEKKRKRKLVIKCKRPQFNFYEGDTYPKFKPMPLASRQWQHRDSRGDYFTIYPTQSNVQEDVDTSITFKDVNLDNRLIENLEKIDIVHPMPIQKLALPIILEGQNAMLTAETGCGKTYAFLIPLIQQILQWKQVVGTECNRPLGLILTPSRELTQQISKEAKNLTKGLGINIITLIGGKSKKIIENPPVGEFDLVIATLGVMRKLVATEIFKLDRIRHVVLDEADTLFDESFSDSVCQFLRKITLGTERGPDGAFPPTAQVTLNSATIPQNLRDSLYKVVDSDSIVPVATGFEHRIRVPQKFLRLGPSEKPMELLKLIKPKVKSKIPVIIFSNRTETCDFTSIFLKQFGIKCVNLHKNQSVLFRRGKFMEFQNGLCHVLTTTDSGARGLDTTIAKDVINYDFPLITSEYIHRCGRIGRLGSPQDCRVINFISRPLEIILTKKIEFAARRMNPIPMVDMIHTGEDESDFFTPKLLDKNTEGEDVEERTVLDDMEEAGFRVPQ